MLIFVHKRIKSEYKDESVQIFYWKGFRWRTSYNFKLPWKLLIHFKEFIKGVNFLFLIYFWTKCGVKWSYKMTLNHKTYRQQTFKFQNSHCRWSLAYGREILIPDFLHQFKVVLSHIHRIGIECCHIWIAVLNSLVSPMITILYYFRISIQTNRCLWFS